jgi:hypothetical protein
MTDWTMQSTEHDLSELLGAFLRRQTSSAKELARLIDCDPRTAEGFRAGRYWPSARHWKLIARAFGRDILAAVFDPDIDQELARLRREERELEERLYELKARRRQALGGLAEHQERREPASYRTPLDRELPFEERV